MSEGVLDSFRLDGEVAVVTGGAGLYGRQIVQALAEAGAKTFLASRNLAAQQEFAARLSASGLTVSPKELDLSSEESIDNLLESVLEETGRVGILVNNAVLRPMKAWEAPSSEFEESMKTNATGSFLITRAFGRHMAENGSGSIINIGSIQGMVGPDFTLYEGLGWGIPPDYFFHKGGLLQLTRFAAAQLGPSGVRVNLISPGGFYDGQDERFVKRYCDRTFLGRMADETDLKGAVVFLASEASRYVTGANLVVDGGYTAK